MSESSNTPEKARPIGFIPTPSGTVGHSGLFSKEARLAYNELGSSSIQTEVESCTRWVHVSTDQPTPPGTVYGNIVLRVLFVGLAIKDEFKTVSGTIDFPQHCDIFHLMPASMQDTLSSTQSWSLNTELQLVDGQQRRRVKWTVSDHGKRRSSLFAGCFYILISVKLDTSEPLDIVVETDVALRSRWRQLYHLLYPGQSTRSLKERIIPRWDSTLFFCHRISSEPRLGRLTPQFKWYGTTPQSFEQDQKELGEYVNKMNHKNRP